MKISDLFLDDKIIAKIKTKLPYLFTIAEAEASRGGKLGMDIGTVRERIIIALLRYYFGSDSIRTDLPIAETEADVIVNNQKISIKTKTGNALSGIKAIWTVDWDKVDSFVENFSPAMDMILIQIVWNTKNGGVFYIPKSVQDEVFTRTGNGKYFKKPARNTNPREVEYSRNSISSMLGHSDTIKIGIEWFRDENLKIDIYEKWESYWKG